VRRLALAGSDHVLRRNSSSSSLTSNLSKSDELLTIYHSPSIVNPATLAAIAGVGGEILRVWISLLLYHSRA